MKFIRIFLLIAIGIFITTDAFSQARSDKIRFRALVIAMDNSDIGTTGSNVATQEISKEPISSGGSIYGIFYGLGFGYSAIKTEFARRTEVRGTEAHLMTESTSATANFVEFALTVGEDWTLSVGVGTLLNGSFESKIDYGPTFEDVGAQDETIKAKSMTGTSSFAIVGCPCRGMEILLGMRWNTIKAEMDTEDSSAKKLDDAGRVEVKEKLPVELKTAQAVVGVGIAF